VAELETKLDTNSRDDVRLRLLGELSLDAKNLDTWPLYDGHARYTLTRAAKIER
jgi:hypothetical protein